MRERCRVCRPIAQLRDQLTDALTGQLALVVIDDRLSKLDPFTDGIHRLLGADPKVRPLFGPPPRTFKRTVYRRGEICQFDLWAPKAEVPVGHGQTRRGWVVVAWLGYSRAGAGALVFSKQTPDLLAGIARCLWSLGALPERLVWDRQAGIHGHGGRPSEEFAAFCGQLRADWQFCAPADPQAKGVVERLQDFIERRLRAGPGVRERARLPVAARQRVSDFCV